MYIEFDDLRPDTPRIDHPISVREGVLVSVILHLCGIIALLVFVRLAPEATATATVEPLEAQVAEPADEAGTFVFVQPRIDTPAPSPPSRAELSDQDRQAQAPDRALFPQNPLPFSLGDSAERVEPPEDVPVPAEDRLARRDPAPDLASPSEFADAVGGGERASGPDVFSFLDEGAVGRNAPREAAARAPGESLGRALQNLQEYIDRETFNNPDGGGGQFGPSIQFDTKGVEFGPWIRRFVAQIKRNWILPYAAIFASMRGEVVITFNVHKSGALTDLTVVRPSAVDGFTNSAYNALASSNPTFPLPEEYPTEQAFFTVTFYFNQGPR